MWVLKNFTDFDKEEKWLEDMAKKGYRLTKASSGSYHFIQTNKPCDYTIKIDYRSICRENDYMNYCAMFEDSGWQHIAGSKWTGAHYFVKSRPDAGDDIFSDQRSRAERYKRLSFMLLSMAVIYTSYIFIFAPTSLSRVGQLYETAGVWDRKGWHLVLQFLFVTPFELMRLLPLLIFFGFVLYFIYYTIKALLLYRKQTIQ